MEKLLIALQTFPVNHSKQLGLQNHHHDVLEESIWDLEQKKQVGCMILQECI